MWTGRAVPGRAGPDRWKYNGPGRAGLWNVKKQTRQAGLCEARAGPGRAMKFRPVQDSYSYAAVNGNSLTSKLAVVDLHHRCVHFSAQLRVWTEANKPCTVMQQQAHFENRVALIIAGFEVSRANRPHTSRVSLLSSHWSILACLCSTDAKLLCYRKTTWPT
jgi:hypothetical protein